MVKSEFIIVRVGNECGSNIFVAVNNHKGFQGAELFDKVEIIVRNVMRVRNRVVIQVFVDIKLESKVF